MHVLKPSVHQAFTSAAYSSAASGGVRWLIRQDGRGRIYWTMVSIESGRDMTPWSNTFASTRVVEWEQEFDMTKYQFHWWSSSTQRTPAPSVTLEAVSRLEGAALALQYFSQLGVISVPLAHVDFTEADGRK